MSEYWKSLPRKFCEACKCWFADNKASIEFHERGKRHKENVEKRLAQLYKKGKKDFDDHTRYEKAMAKIEKAAQAAYKKDVESDPTLVVKPKVSALAKVLKEVQDPKDSGIDVKEWWEAKDDEGNIYFWNSNTGASQWETPKEPYVTMEDQLKQAAAEEASSSPSQDEPEQGPQQRVDPYGKWTSVNHAPAKPLDLQLPVIPCDLQEYATDAIPEITEEEDTAPKNRFKEKTLESLGKSVASVGDGTFRKRKNLSDTKRNVRRRADDE